MWLGSPRFPGSGFPLTPPSRSGLPPPPRPRNVLLHSGPPHKGRPLGDATAPPPTRGEPRRGQCGQDAWVLSSLLPSQGEIPPRSPQALGSQNNPAGEGRLLREGKQEERRTELRGAAGACGEQALGKEGPPGGLGHHLTPGLLARPLFW